MNLFFLRGGIFLLWCGALSPSAFGQARAGSGPDTATAPNELPVQNYAVIDVSGANAASDVYAMELSDANQVAYAYWNPSGQYVVNKWSNGNTTAAVTTITPDPPEAAIPGIDCFFQTASADFYQLNLDGTVIGWLRETIDIIYTEGYYAIYDWGDTAKIVNYAGSNQSEASLPDSHLHSTLPEMVHYHGGEPPWRDAGLLLNGISKAGYFGEVESIYFTTDQSGETTPEHNYGNFGFWGEYNSSSVSFQVNAGRVTLFDTNIAADGPKGANIFPVAADYEPWIMNDLGQTVGYGNDSNPDETFYWPYPSIGTNAPAPPGAMPIDVGAGAPCGLSNEGRIIFDQSNYQGDRTIHHGKVWQKNQTTSFNDLLAGTAFKSYDSVTPLLISNENPADHSFSVVTQVDDGTDYQLVLWKYGPPPLLADGTRPPPQWQAYQMQVPDGVSWGSLEVINSSGVIAAVGDPGTGGSHALLLVPATFTVTNWKPAITAPEISYEQDSNGAVQKVVIGVPNDGEIMNVSAQVQIDLPDVGQTDSLAQQFEIVLLQNIVLCDPGSQVDRYADAVPTPQYLSPIPGQDSNLVTPDEKASEDSLPRIIRFSKNHEKLANSVKDSPARPPGHALSKYVPVWGDLTTDTRNNEFITYLFAQPSPNQSADTSKTYYKGLLCYKPIFLKWFRWRASYKVKFDFSKEPYGTKETWDFQLIQEGIGQGPQKPVYKAANPTDN